jgi:predicted nucleic acid-binding protein
MVGGAVSAKPPYPKGDGMEAAETTKPIVYLDNCCYNRPFDDQNQLRIELETKAKLHIQKQVVDGALSLTISFMSVTENNDNPFEDKRIPISEFFSNATSLVEPSDTITQTAKELVTHGLKPKDAIHAACAIESGCDYFLTTDDKLARFKDRRITIINPIDFIRMKEAENNE